MRTHALGVAIVVAAVLCSSSVGAQRGGRGGAETPLPCRATARGEAPLNVDGWGRPLLDKPKDFKPGPAPKRDLSGIYEPAEGWRAGVQATGAHDSPSDRTHPLPFTPLGD